MSVQRINFGGDSYMDEWRTRLRACKANDILTWEDWDQLPDIDLAMLIQELSKEGMELAAKTKYLGTEMEKRIRIKTAVAAQETQRRMDRESLPLPKRRKIATGLAAKASSSASAVKARPPLHHANMMVASTASVTPPSESQTMAALSERPMLRA